MKGKVSKYKEEREREREREREVYNKSLVVQGWFLKDDASSSTQ